MTLLKSHSDLILGCFFFLASMAATAQDYYTNDPTMADLVMNGFLMDAQERGIEVKERLQKVDKIIFSLKSGTSHQHKDGECIIRIGFNKYDTEAEIKRKAYHELGHHFGLEHCGDCTYNIMAELQDSQSLQLWDLTPVQNLYIDLFFEQIRNPSEPHKHY